MTILERITIPEVTLPLVGIFGLLVIWQYHQNLVLAGRIHAIDFWDVSGIRLLLHMTLRDGSACPSCQAADGTVFLPSLATKKNFSCLHGPCSNPGGCRCVTIGLYGGWSEANHLVEKLRAQSRNSLMKLEREQFLQLFDEPWNRSGDSTAADYLATRMLEAVHLEVQDLEKAIFGYRWVVDLAVSARDLHMLVPAYLRLSELLERVGRYKEAFEIIERFENRFFWKKSRAYYPSDAQRDLMAASKARLGPLVSRENAPRGSLRQGHVLRALRVR